MKIDIVTIFPGFFAGTLDYGIIRRAREARLVEVTLHDLRDFTHDRHKTVDDRPFGGGEGMVLKPDPIFECLDAMDVSGREGRAAAQESVILLSAQGRRFTQREAHDLSALDRLVLICGRYEGVDERVGAHLADREYSIGDYVLSGGEIGAAAIVDSVIRLLPGALGNEASARQESFTSGTAVQSNNADSTCASGGLLDYPHYTRPSEFRGLKIPQELASGNHEEIRRWRRREALRKTLRNRPDLILSMEQGLGLEDRRILAELRVENS